MRNLEFEAFPKSNYGRGRAERHHHATTLTAFITKETSGSQVKLKFVIFVLINPGKFGVTEIS